MNVLLLAPHPFYQDRGSPIAVDRVASELSRLGATVDLVTYHEGIDVVYEGVTLHRIPNLPFIKNVRPGFSWKKLVCDFFLIFVALRLVWRREYAFVHAVEEAVFVGLFFKKVFKVPYVYDMDSSLAEQMIEKFRWLAPLLPTFRVAERLAVSNATVTLAVCDALAATAEGHQANKTLVLWDVSLLEKDAETPVEDLRRKLQVDGLLGMYVGNLEAYQGIDLLLESVALLTEHTRAFHLVIIGGSDAHITSYRERAQQFGVDELVHFVGPRRVDDLAMYLAQADVLVSPRIKGNNTPMKIFSYLDSGKPIIATRLLTHTQVLTDEAAVLVEPAPEAFADGLLRLVQDEQLRSQLGVAGKLLVQEKYSNEVYRDGFAQFYEWLNAELTQPRVTSEVGTVSSSRQLDRTG